jgi:DNA invertase Pin-like site-specific DNA recombinase
MGKIYGYARVSSTEQNLDRQILELERYVSEENIVVDKQSGKTLQRPGYMALKGALGLRKGDTLYVTSLDRLSRNKEDIQKELQWFKQQGIRLMILDLPTTMVQVPDGQEWILDMVNSILIEVLSSIAQQERETIRKRQRQGIDAAKAKGKHLGRPSLKMPENFGTVYMEWKSGRYTAKKAMEILAMKSTSFYRMVRQYEDANGVPKG